MAAPPPSAETPHQRVDNRPSSGSPGRLLCRLAVSLGVATSALGLSACSDVYSLGIYGANGVLAVGASVTYVLDYRRSFDCRTDRFIKCGSGNMNSVTQTTEVRIDDPAIAQVVLQPDQKIAVRALKAGSTQLHASGINAQGQTVSADRFVTVMVAQEAVLDTVDICEQSALGVTHTVPVNATLNLTAVLRSGTQDLLGDGISIPLDRGAMLPGPLGSSPLTLLAPAMPTVTAVTSQLEKPFRLPLRVYDPSQVDGARLTPIKPGPYFRQDTHVLRLDLLVQGDRVCQLPDPPQQRTVTILTRDLCVFRNGNDPTSTGAGFVFEGPNLAAVYVTASRAGTCTLRTTVAGTPIMSDYDFVFSEP